MKYKLIQRAYKIDFDKIEEGYLASDQICHADNINKAKSILLGQISYENWKLKYLDKEITYLTIPVKRYPEGDWYEFEGEKLPLFGIQSILDERERILKLNQILENDNVKYCYIKKGNYYRPNSSGYTDYAIWAGVYPKEDAVRAAKSCRDINLITINIDDHNAMINKEIENLKTRLL